MLKMGVCLLVLANESKHSFVSIYSYIKKKMISYLKKNIKISKLVTSFATTSYNIVYMVVLNIGMFNICILSINILNISFNIGMNKASIVSIEMSSTSVLSS